MNDGIGLAEVLLGLPGFRVLDVVETDVEVVDRDRDDGGCGRSVGPAGCAPRRRIGCVSTCAIWPASGGRRGWCGASGGGVAGSRCARHGRGPSTPSTSTRRRC